MKNEVKVALLGFGNVGCGTYKALSDNAALIEKKTGAKITVKKIMVRDLAKPRLYEAPAELFTDKFEDIVNDPEIDIVAELMGGLEPATSYMLAAFKAGKHVVSANKAALAAALPEIQNAAIASKCMLRYEAAVCGAIPVMNAISTALTANKITEVRGIVNGTTNYILTQMAENGLPYAEVLKDAQAKGFAEADPTGDVEGYDAANKLSLLIATAFGKYMAPDSFERVGITGVTMEDLKAAEEKGCKIKLIAGAKDLGDHIEASVKPTLVPNDNPLAGVRNEFNAVLASCNMAGDIFLQGRGAGPDPTGSAVAADISEIAAAIINGTADKQLQTAFI